jgi:hypothetical protein
MIVPPITTLRCASIRLHRHNTIFAILRAAPWSLLPTYNAIVELSSLRSIKISWPNDPSMLKPYKALYMFPLYDFVTPRIRSKVELCVAPENMKGSDFSQNVVLSNCRKLTSDRDFRELNFV